MSLSLLGVFLPLSLFVAFPPPLTALSPIDCAFDSPAPSHVPFCSWLPDSDQSSLLWHIGSAVLVDAVNSVVRSTAASSGRENRFAFVQGRFGAPTEGSLRSALIGRTSKSDGDFSLSLVYWKKNAAPSLDICVEEAAGEGLLRCVDSIQGPGQHQWVRRTVELPRIERPFRVVLRARNILAAEDIIGVDDVQLLEKEGGEAENVQHVRHQQQFRGTEKVGHRIGAARDSTTSPKNPFEGIDEELEQDQKQQQWRAEEFGAKKLTETKIFATDGPAGAREAEAPSAHPIRPQIRLSPQSSALPRPSENEAPFPTNSLRFADPLQSNSETAKADSRCPAVSCSFLEGLCLWRLGPGWHNTSAGSLSVQSPLVHPSQISSAPFKATVPAAVDFDLWMSDNAEIAIVESASGTDKDALMKRAEVVDEAEGALLFKRRGPTDGGWHRFRVPLRSSSAPIRLIFRAQFFAEQFQTVHASAPPFISLSRIKLVDGEGNEIACDVIPPEGETETQAEEPAGSGTSLGRGLSPLDEFFGVRQPAPLLLLPSQFPLPPPFPLPVPSSNPPILSPTSPFNPLKPMFEGILPIVPLRDNPPRLTALMDAPRQREQHIQISHSQLISTQRKGKEGEEEEEKPKIDRLVGGEKKMEGSQQYLGEGLLPFAGSAVEDVSEGQEGDEVGGEVRWIQKERIIRPESELEGPKMPRLMVLPRGNRKGKGPREQLLEGGGDEWPTVEMGRREEKRGKSKDRRGKEGGEAGSEFRRMK